MSERQGRRTSRHRTRSAFSLLGRSLHRRSGLDWAARERGAATPTPSNTKRSGSVYDRLADTTWTACVAAGLLGATTGIIVSGLAQYFHTGFAENSLVGRFPPSRAIIVGASLLALGIGVRFPQRLAIWMCTPAWRRFAIDGRAWSASGILVSPGAPERRLYWAVFSIVALGAGIAVALLPACVPPASATYRFLHVHFVWSDAPLAMLNFSVSIVAGLVPLALLGLALSCAHHLCCTHGQWDIRATAWAIIGAGFGAGVAEWYEGAGGRVAPLLIGAALPALAVAIGAAVLGSAKDHQEVSEEVSREASACCPLPVCSDRWPTLLRASIVAVGGGGVCAIFVSSQWLNRGQVQSTGILPHLLAAVGIGIAVGSRVPVGTVRTIGAFGMGCAVAGIVVGVSTFALASQPHAPSWLATVFAASGAATIGYATSFGRTVLLSRVARRSTAGARMLARMLVCGAVTILVAAPIATYLFREPATLMLLSMSLIALGGLLVIHEPSYTPQVRRARLGTVFGSVAAMILLGSMSFVARLSRPPVELVGDVAMPAATVLPGETKDVAAGDR